MRIAPIRTPEAYEAAMAKAAELAARTDQAALDELEVLEAVLAQWERKSVEIPPPEPLEAIRFRMRQSGLRPRDLEPFIGSRARVSEVLSGTRQLTIDMIRSLHRHLGIPASSLLAAGSGHRASSVGTPSNSTLRKLGELGVLKSGEDFAAFVDRAFASNPAGALLRKTRTARTNAKTDQTAVAAWCSTVMLKAQAVKIGRKKAKARATETARALAKLSAIPDGPARVRDELVRIGIILIILEHLPGTYLDGAAMCRGDGVPIIALTLRYDRIDNFWFTLLHEFCHVSEHLIEGRTLILDDLEVSSSDTIEEEADTFAQEALIPQSVWSELASPNMQVDDVMKLAAEAAVHPAIVAGRWQRENGDYRRFAKMLGRGQIRTQLIGGNS